MKKKTLRLSSQQRVARAVQGLRKTPAGGMILDERSLEEDRYAAVKTAGAKPLKERARVHLHAYTSETIAEVRLYGKKQMAPGETTFAQLRLQDPTLMLPGDRFILRQFSPVVTVGGGVVLDAAPIAKLKREAVESRR